MAKVIDWNIAALTCSIPLELAVYCVNCNRISNSRPHPCAVCRSEAVLRLRPISSLTVSLQQPSGGLSKLHTHM